MSFLLALDCDTTLNKYTAMMRAPAIVNIVSYVSVSWCLVFRQYPSRISDSETSSHTSLLPMWCGFTAYFQGTGWHRLPATSQLVHPYPKQQ